MTNLSKLTIVNDIFPEAESVFSWRPLPLASIIESCLFVLDTSTLLLPYEIGSQSYKDIEAALRILVERDRIRIPGQAAREFARRRPSLLLSVHNQINVRKSKAKRIESGYIPLLERLTDYQHAIEIEKQINDLYDKYQNLLKLVADQVQSWEWNDPVSELYHELFSKDVVEDYEINSTKLSDEFERRKQFSLPPGYKDSAKSDNAAGDLVIWKTILEIGSRNESNLIFVTAEKKSDWWHRDSVEGIYPRYELVDEYRRSSNGQTFHIIPMSKLLIHYGASRETIEEVRREEIDSTYRLTIDQIQSDWPNIKQQIKELGDKGRRIEAVLQNVDPVYLVNGMLYLVTPYEFHRNRVNSKEVNDEISSALFQKYGFRIRCRAISREDLLVESERTDIE